MKVNEVIETISGEAGGIPQGSWVAIVRLQGCNLRCRWCDTPRAQEEDEGGRGLSYPMDLDRIQTMIGHRTNIMITGGEPLLQEETPNLIARLLYSGHQVQIETNGSIPIPSIMPSSAMQVDLPNQLHWVIDRKGPSSGMSDLMLDAGDFHKIQGSCHFKWVVADDQDIEYMVEDMQGVGAYSKIRPASYIVSPVGADGGMIPDIVERIKEEDRRLSKDLLNRIVFSVQLHKIGGMP